MLEFTKKENSAAKAYLVAGAVWFAIGTSYGLLSAIHLMAPEFFNNIPWLVFGRTRPVHVNTVIYGFVVNTLIGAALYYVPALLKTRLWSNRLAWAAWALWQAAVLSGPLGFPFAITQGREYAEYVYVFDVCIMLSLLLLLVDLLVTLANRQEKTLYVSVWYVFGTIIWTAGVYPIGNVMWHPAHGAMPGLLDSILLWFYGHNLVGLLMTPLAVGAAYYILPRVTNTPLYSHTLSLIGFWALVAIYTHIGGHHLLQTPMPAWLKTISVVDSMMMFIPVLTVLVNVWMTTRGATGKIWADVPGRFVMVGTLWYLVTCTQGPIQSLPSVQQVTHYTNWTIGHAHIAVLGFAGFIALGSLWHVLPLAAGRRVWSRKLLSLQFGLVLFGLGGFFVVLTMAGLVQGESWFNGKGVYVTLPQIVPYMALRALLGISIITGAYLGLVNLVMTLRAGEKIEPARDGGSAS